MILASKSHGAEPQIDPRIIGLANDSHPLSLIDNFILACGWTHEAEGFVAPERWRELIAVHHGRGRHWDRESAVRFCVRYHERCWLPPNLDAKETAETKRPRHNLALSLENMINRAAGALPEGWQIQVEVEAGYGGVVVTSPDGTKTPIEQDDADLPQKFQAAIDYIQKAAMF